MFPENIPPPLQPCDDCEDGSTTGNGKGSPGQSNQAQCPDCQDSDVDKAPTRGKSTYAQVKLGSGNSTNRSRSQCIKVPLKSGGKLSLAWNRFAGQGYDATLGEMAVGPDAWLPAGRGGLFSFLPFLAQSGSTYRRFSDAGALAYTKQGASIASISYYTPNCAVPWLGRYDHSTYFFTEYSPETGSYFRYAGTGHLQQGRPLERFDRNGNKLTYAYSARQGSPSASYRGILRKITGDLGGVTPYFEYGGASVEENQPAPIRKVFLYDGAAAANSRSIYFTYQDPLTMVGSYLQLIVNPNGCTNQYGLIDSNDSSHTTNIHKEVDADGYTTYFEYEDPTQPLVMNRSVQPEGRAMRYQYDDGETQVGNDDRGVTYYRYNVSALGSVPLRTAKRDAVGKTTYYQYNARDRYSRVTDPNGNVSYYEYDANTDALTKKISASNGATTQYVYAANNEDLHKEIGPRNVGGFSVVTYYEYNGNRDRVAVTDALGNKTQTGLDALGRVRKRQDPRGNSTYYNFDATTGSPSSNVDAKNQAAYFRYNSFRDLVRSVSPRYVETGSFATFTSYFEYDALDRKRKAIDAAGSVSYFDYTSRGDLAAAVDPRGVDSTYRYDGLRRQTKANVAASAGGSNLWTQYYVYDTRNNRTRSRDGNGNWTYMGYDALNRAKKSVDAEYFSTYFEYDAVGNRRKILNARKFTSYFFYDSLSQLKAQRDTRGFDTYFFYDVAGNRTRIRDARLNTTYYLYDQLDRQNALRDALGQATYYFYDADSNRTRVRDARLNTTYFAYDALNQQNALRDALGQFTYYFYDAAGNRTRVRDERLNTTYYFYDNLDRMKSTRDAQANATYHFYDAVGNVTRRRDARLNTTYYAYDGLSRTTRLRDASGNAAYFAYLPEGNTSKAVSLRGFVTYFAYDARNMLHRRRDAESNTTYFAYDPVGSLQYATDARGQSTVYDYDGDGRVASVSLLSLGWDTQNWDTTGYGGVTSPLVYFTYDAAGNRRKTISARQFATYFNFDSLNRTTNVQDAVGGNAYFGYDAVSNTTRVRDALARTTYFVYDNLNRINVSTDALNNSAYFTYDAAGNRRLERDARGNRTYYNYDTLNRLSYATDPLALNAYYAYDAVSNLRRTVDNDGTATYFGYDALNRRTRIAYPSTTQYFEYDAEGNLTRVADGWGTSTFGYDKISRLTRRNTPRGDAVYYAYDGNSNMAKLQYPRGTAACYYTYDIQNRTTKADSPSAHRTYFDYDLTSNITKKRLGNGITAYFAYDNTDRATAIRYLKAGGGVTYFVYGRDVSGRINVLRRETDLNVYYTYDNIDRLTAETWRKRSDNSQIYAFSYAYDATSNRTRMRREIRGTEFENAYYVYNADNSLKKVRNLLPSAQTAYYKYDANGALVKKYDSAATYFEYGPHQLVTKITPPAGSPWNFYYDGRLNRYKIDQAGTVSYYLWDGLNLLEERNSDGTLKARYTHGYARNYGIGSIVEVERHTSTTTYYQYLNQDHRGSVYAVTDQNKNTQLSYVQDAFGRPLAAIGGSDPNVPNDLIYQSNALTLKIGGVWYLVSRYRMVKLDDGVFLSRDFLPYLNKYRAFSNNPVGQVDRDGLSDSESSTTPTVPGLAPATPTLVELAIEAIPAVISAIGTAAAAASKMLPSGTGIGAPGPAAYYDPTTGGFNVYVPDLPSDKIRKEGLAKDIAKAIELSGGPTEPAGAKRDLKEKEIREFNDLKEELQLKGDLSPEKFRKLAQLEEKYDPNNCGTCNCSCNEEGNPRWGAYPPDPLRPGRFAIRWIKTEADCRNACAQTKHEPKSTFYWCSKTPPPFKMI